MIQLVEIKAIANILCGFPFKGELYTDSGLRVLRGENVTIGNLRWDAIKCIQPRDNDELEKYLLAESDVVIGMDGSRVGRNRARIQATDLPLILAQRVARLRNKENSDITFLYYLFRWNRFEEYVERVQTGSAVPHISQKQIESYLVPKHDLSTQQKIASVLSALDDKIELNNRINTELEAMAKLIYEYWFVQFDFPDADGKPYKASGGRMVWNEVLKRDIPEGWEVKSWQDLIAHDKTGDWGKEELEGNYRLEVQCIRGADINGINGKGEVKAPTRFILEKNKSKVLSPWDLVIEISGGSPTQSTGRIAGISREVIDRFSTPLICSNFCKAISLTDPTLFYFFVNTWNRAYDGSVFFGFEGKTSGIKNLLFDSLIESMKVAVPPETSKLMQRFHELILPNEKLRQKNLAQNQHLATLRDWLLPMLMNGQVTVGENAVGAKSQTADSIPNYSPSEGPLNIAAEPSTAYNINPSADLTFKNPAFSKQVLAGKVVSLFKDEPGFTHIKFQKIQFLAEHIAEADLNLNYYYQSAGPYDNRFMHSIADKFRMSKWFNEQNFSYRPMEKLEQIDRYFQGDFKPKLEILNRLFSLLKGKTEAETEVLATTYAVWNNRLILGQPVEAEGLVNDFFEWSDRKHQYTADQVLDAIQWLAVNGFKPKGFGKELKRAKK